VEPDDRDRDNPRVFIMVLDLLRPPQRTDRSEREGYNWAWLADNGELVEIERYAFNVVNRDVLESHREEAWEIESEMH
jgi:hypothetical protein